MNVRRHVLVFTLLLAAEAARADDPKMEAALTACRQLNEASRTGQCYVLFGLAGAESRNRDVARQNFEEAARRFEAADDPTEAWKALWILVESERRFGRQPDFTVSVIEKALGVVERAKGRSAPARPDSLQLLEAVSRDGYAAALLDVGELEKAEVQLALASQLAEPFRAMLDRSIARNVGRLRRRQWRLDEARASYQKALAAPKTRLPFTVDDRREGDVAALHGLAEIEVLAGRTDEALQWNDRALDLARTAGERGAELTLLGNRASILERGGRFAAAEQTYAQALTTAKAQGNPKEQATLLANRASMYMNLGRYGEAMADSEQSLELAAGIEDPLAQAAFLAHVAGMYFSIGARDSGTSVLEKARAVAAKSQSRLGAALLDVIAAGHAGSSAELDKAIERFLQLPEVRGMENMQQLAALLRAVTGPNPAADVNALDRGKLVLEGGISELLELLSHLNEDSPPRPGSPPCGFWRRIRARSFARTCSRSSR